MTTPRGFKDRADDSLFTLLGEIPELVKNLVVAEVDAAKSWLTRVSKDFGIGAGWFVVALFFLFWTIATLIAFVIIGLSSWWAPWLSALVVFGGMLLLTVLFVLLGILRFRKGASQTTPVQSVATDVKEIRDEL